MCAIDKFLFVLVLVLTISLAAADQVVKEEKITDKTKESFKEITNAPKNIKGNISVTDTDASTYSIAVNKDKTISIKKTENKDEHTKANVKFSLKYIESLPGYDGKKIAVANMVNGQITNYREINVKAHTSGNTVIVPVTFSEVIVGGMTGWYVKTVSNVNPVNTTISFAVQNATGAYVQTNAPPTYMVWNESNISTYPNPTKWTLVWTLDGNSTGANDISGNSRHGTIVAAKTTADSRGTSGKALYFDNNDDYITYNYTDTLYANLTAFYGYKVTGYADDCITDLRTAAGVGRTGWYTHNNIYKINNATTVNTLNSSSNVWNYAFTDLGSSQTNWVWVGARYTLANDFSGWLDVFGLYNGTISATNQRQISMGYKGIKVKSNTGTFVPLTSSNQSIAVGTTVASITLQSNNDTLRTFTFAAPFQQNYTEIRDWDLSSTVHRIDTSFTPKTNVTTGTLSNTIDKSYLYGTPTLSSNDAGASVTKSGATLSITLGTITAGTNKYYNVSLPILQRSFTTKLPVNSTLSLPQSTAQIFNVTANGTTDIVWKRNGTIIETDSNTLNALYTFSDSNTGDYLVEASAPGCTEQWIVTVYDVSAAYPKVRVRDWDTNNETCNGNIDIDNVLTAQEWTFNLTNVTNGYNYSLIDAATEAVITSTIAANNSSAIVLTNPSDGSYYIRESAITVPQRVWALALVFTTFFTAAFGYLYKRKR